MHIVAACHQDDGHIHAAPPVAGFEWWFELAEGYAGRAADLLWAEPNTFPMIRLDIRPGLGADTPALAGAACVARRNAFFAAVAANWPAGKPKKWTILIVGPDGQDQTDMYVSANPGDYLPLQVLYNGGDVSRVGLYHDTTLEEQGIIAGTPVTHTIADFQAGILAALQAAPLPAGVQRLPAYDLFTSEGITDLPSEMVQDGAYATHGTWTQSVADARFTSSAVDGASTGAALLAAAQANYAAIIGGALPAYMTGASCNHPANYAAQAYGNVMGASFMYTQGKVFGENAISGKMGNWNTGRWPGSPATPVANNPGGYTYKSFMGKYGPTITQNWKVLIVSMYNSPYAYWSPGTGGGAAGWATSANWLSDFPGYAGANEQETKWKLIGPTGAELARSLLSVYPGMEFWCSYHTGEEVGTDDTLAELEATHSAAGARQMAAAGATGCWCFDIGYDSSAAARAYWLDLVQKFNAAG